MVIVYLIISIVSILEMCANEQTEMKDSSWLKSVIQFTWVYAPYNTMLSIIGFVAELKQISTVCVHRTIYTTINSAEYSLNKRGEEHSLLIEIMISSTQNVFISYSNNISGWMET